MALALTTAALNYTTPTTVKHAHQVSTAPSAVSLQPLGNHNPVRSHSDSATEGPDTVGNQSADERSASPESRAEIHTTPRRPHRVKLCYHDEAYRVRTEARAKGLLADASSTCSSNSALLAKKALKYRKVYERMVSVDVNDPDFDVFEFLGVDWCKKTPVESEA